MLTFALIFLNWENGDVLILMRYFIDISSLEGTYVIFWYSESEAFRSS
jgi:hypothetical protein